MPVARYITAAEMRAEGPPFSDVVAYPDAYVNARIDMASEFIERATGQWFTPKARTLLVDGSGGRKLRIGHPIVQINTITIIYRARYGAHPEYAINLAETRVGNRHLTQGLINPDDRRLPTIEILDWLSYEPEDIGEWPAGVQNIKLEGVFGWTELDQSITPAETVADSQIPAAQGATPFLIKHVCKLLVRHFWPKIGDFSGLMAATKGGAITNMKTRDQSVTYGNTQTGGGEGVMPAGLTGDWEIDNILIDHRITPAMKWAWSGPRDGSRSF